MMNDIEELRDTTLAAIAGAGDLDALEAVRIGALGKQGTVSALLKSLGQMSPEERQVQGPAINGLREAVTAAMAARKAALESEVRALQEHVKASIAPYKYPRAIEFRDKLPRTETGKLQRFRLRQEAA